MVDEHLNSPAARLKQLKAARPSNDKTLVAEFKPMITDDMLKGMKPKARIFHDSAGLFNKKRPWVLVLSFENEAGLKLWATLAGSINGANNQAKKRGDLPAQSAQTMTALFDTARLEAEQEDD